MLVARDGLTLGELPAGPRRHRLPARVAQLQRSASAWRSSGSAATSTPGSARSLRASRRGGAGACRPGPDRPTRRGHRGARPDPDAPRPRAGCAGGRVPRRRPDLLTAPPASRTRHPGGGGRRAGRAGHPRGGVLGAGRALAEVVEGEDGESCGCGRGPRTRRCGCGPRMSATGPLADAAGLGRRLATEMLAEGAARLIDAEDTRTKAAGMTDARPTKTDLDRRHVAPRAGCRSWAVAPATPTC